MSNQQEVIKGYRKLSQEEVDLINEVKLKAEELGELVDKIMQTESTDKRWVSIAKTDFQTGTMALVRSIAKQTTF